EDDRERAEAERESPAVGPREQAVEAVGEQELGGDEGGGVVDLAPVVAPVEDDGALLAGLQVVLPPRPDLERHGLPAAEDAEEQSAPGEEDQGGGGRGGARHGAVLQDEQAEQEQAGAEAGVEEKGAAGREAGLGRGRGGRGVDRGGGHSGRGLGVVQLRSRPVGRRRDGAVARGAGRRALPLAAGANRLRLRTPAAAAVRPRRAPLVS